MTRPRGLHIDAVALSLVAAIVLLGLIMVTSASISIASKESGDAFSYLERQLVLCLIGFALAAMVFCVRTEYLEKSAWPLLIIAVGLLFFVLIPGLGHVVNGSRRWIRVMGFNFQASELARVLTLIFIASYAVRREDELRNTAMGLIKPMALLAFVAMLLLAEPDFGAASVLLIAGFGILFVAGARLRYVIMVAAVCAGAMALLVMLVPYRMARVTSFLDPWADPFNSGFQLTQSLIAIGRGEWFGVGLGESVQKLFYLPEAHTDFLFAVLAEELGLVGVAITLALFIALVWRSFWIAQLASRAGLRFQAYLAAGNRGTLTGRVVDLRTGKPVVGVTMTARLVHYCNPARTWPEIIIGIFSIDPAFDGMHTGIIIQSRNGFAGSNFYLFLDQVVIGYFFCNTMFNLDPGIHFHEIKIPVLVYKEFNSTHTFIIDGTGSFLGSFTHFIAKLRCHEWRWRFFNKFLMSSLNAAVTLTQVTGLSVLVAGDLYFDMAGFLDIFFHVHAVVSKCCTCFLPGTFPGTLYVFILPDYTHPSAATAGSRLHDYRVADLFCNCFRIIYIFQQSF